MPQTHAFPVSLENSCQLYGTRRKKIPFLTMTSIIIHVLTTTRKISVATPGKNTFQWTVSRKTPVHSQDFQLCIRERSWMLSMPTKSEEDFSAIDGIISLIYIYSSLWLPESHLRNHLHFRHWREHTRGTKWRKSKTRVDPLATHKHSCRKWEFLPAAISYGTDRK